MPKPKFSPKELAEYKMLQKSPIYFVEKVWGLIVQPAKPEHRKRLFEIMQLTHEEWEEGKLEIQAEWFGDFDETSGRWKWFEFERGKHITWQQWLIFLSLQKAINHEAEKIISVASGRGIGKSATISMAMLWFLFAFPDCQIPCTAPGFQQMYDVLWKEIALWIHRMPPNIKGMYDWESSHVRIKESPYTWFARAKTASKENPEALSGVHADYVLALVDEGSAVDDPIYEAAQGIFSSFNAFMLIISNPTRRNGYFFRSHHQSKANFQTLQFSSTESPIVDVELVKKYADDGTISDKYRINVLGQFPKEDAIDDASYIQLINDKVLAMQRMEDLRFRDPVLGVDPSGEGDNETAYCIRDHFAAQIVGVDTDSTSKSIARSVITLTDKYRVNPSNIVVDAFGTGYDVGKELALAMRWNVHTVNLVEKPENENDKDEYLNKRAEMYWKMKMWLERGGMLDYNQKLKEQLLSIRFRRSLSGKIEIMPKKEMRRLGIPSPDLVDALAMTFLKTPGKTFTDERQKAILSTVPFNKWGI